MHIPGPLFETNLKKLKKQLPHPTHLHLGYGTFLSQNNLMKLKSFFLLDATPFGETGCLGNLYYLLAAQAYSFNSSPPLPKHSQLGHTSYPTPQ